MIFLLPLVAQPFPFGADFDGKSRQEHAKTHEKSGILVVSRFRTVCFLSVFALICQPCPRPSFSGLSWLRADPCSACSVLSPPRW